MIRRRFHFCLVPPDKLPESQSRKWDREKAVLLKPLARAINTLGDYEVDLTPANAEALLEFLQQVRKEKGRLNTLTVSEELVDDEQTPVEWFVVDPQDDGGAAITGYLSQAFEAEDDLPEVKADRMRPGVHASGWIFVSERFKALVEHHRLTGVEFVWCVDKGKYRALQWYMPVCHKPLGRGVDHPAFDTTKLSGRGFQVKNPLGRHGQCGMFAEQVKQDVAFADPLLSKIVKLATSMELLKRPPPFRSFPRFLKKYLPRTDFAYTIEDIDGDGDSLNRKRGLALNRKARDLLIANRVLSEKDCVNVLVLERPPKGVENLDARHGPAPPAFSPEQMTRLRELEAAAWARHVAHPKPPRVPDLKRSLALLRARKRRAPSRFAKPVRPKALSEAVEALKLEIPAAWQAVLRVTNGGRIPRCPLADDQACLIVPAEKLVESRELCAGGMAAVGGKLPKKFLSIVETEIGDYVCLDASQVKPDGDCPVLLMSHEVAEAERQWPSVAEFLEELLTKEED